MIIKDDYFNKMYKNLVTELHECPDYLVTNKSGDKLYEFINPSITLMNPINCFATCRDMSMKYLEGELEWYYSGSPYLEDISKYSRFWEGISDDGWSAVSNYGKFLFHDRNTHNFTQLEYALSCLLKNPESKKAVMLIYGKENSYKSKDNPCTMFLQFFIRDNRLNLFVKMRSSDIWFGMPYDVPFFVSVQYLMCYVLKQNKYYELQLGEYNHQSGSLHLYDRNLITVLDKIKSYEKNSSLTEDQSKLFETFIEPKVQDFIKNHKIQVISG